MKNKPLVSVVVPAWNAENFLEEAVNSVTAQTYKNIEIIIINDKSSDATGDLAEELAKKDRRIKVIHNNKNLGIGSNRKKGVSEAKGKYICWQDADDISFPDRIESQVKTLEVDEKIGVIGGWLVFFDEKGDGAIRKYSKNDIDLRRNVFKYNPVAQPASMFRKEVFDVVGQYNDKLRVSEDLEMFLRVGEKYNFANIQKPAIKYRQLKNSLTSSKLRQMEKETLKLRKKYKKSSAYDWTLSDSLYNFAQKITIYIPTSLRMKLFGFIRGDKK